eukprot:2982932-Pleurochrysis_carterae.AAC.2
MLVLALAVISMWACVTMCSTRRFCSSSLSPSSKKTGALKPSIEGRAFRHQRVRPSHEAQGQPYRLGERANHML